jgi:hypothetical protein
MNRKWRFTISGIVTHIHLMRKICACRSPPYAKFWNEIFVWSFLKWVPISSYFYRSLWRKSDVRVTRLQVEKVQRSGQNSTSTTDKECGIFHSLSSKIGEALENRGFQRVLELFLIRSCPCWGSGRKTILINAKYIFCVLWVEYFSILTNAVRRRKGGLVSGW